MPDSMTHDVEQYLINNQGWLPAARRVPSPNKNSRPPSTVINTLVIHNISLPPEQFGGGHIEQFFMNQLEASAHPYFSTIHTMEVSAHMLITRKGEMIQFVSFDERAWHAGQSCFQGRDNCNDFSVGIELEGADTIAYTHEQYTALALVSCALMQTYPHITRERIIGHNDIAPERKTDPGEAFDWPRYRDLLSGDEKS